MQILSCLTNLDMLNAERVERSRTPNVAAVGETSRQVANEFKDEEQNATERACNGGTPLTICICTYNH
jgi:hypothetical protein